MWLASIVPVRSQRTAVVFALMLAVRGKHQASQGASFSDTPQQLGNWRRP